MVATQQTELPQQDAVMQLMAERAILSPQYLLLFSDIRLNVGYWKRSRNKALFHRDRLRELAAGLDPDPQFSEMLESAEALITVSFSGKTKPDDRRYLAFVPALAVAYAAQVGATGIYDAFTARFFPAKEVVTMAKAGELESPEVQLALLEHPEGWETRGLCKVGISEVVFLGLDSKDTAAMAGEELFRLAQLPETFEVGDVKLTQIRKRPMPVYSLASGMG
jgi:hypothetical protein